MCKGCKYKKACKELSGYGFTDLSCKDVKDYCEPKTERERIAEEKMQRIFGGK